MGHRPEDEGSQPTTAGRMKKQAALTQRQATFRGDCGDCGDLGYGVVYRERAEFWPEWWPWCWSKWVDIGTMVVRQRNEYDLPSESVCFAYDQERAEKIRELVQKNGVRWYRHPHHAHYSHWEAIQDVIEWEE
jgi:hypothetical protein